MLKMLRALSTGLLFVCALSAQAQSTYPTKPIKMIVPLAPGSAVDNAARIVTQKMSEGLGQAIVIENVPGSAGLIGADRVAKAAPDGYTIGGYNDSVLTMIPHIYKQVPWNALTDFDPISLVATVEWGLIVKTDAPYKTTAEFIAAAKAAPGKLNYSSGGNGSPQHLAMALLASRAGIDVMHVPYKGATPAAVAVAAGEVQASMQGIGTSNALLQSGKARMLGVSTRERLPQFASVPTINESGLKDFYFDSWFAMVAPHGTPKEIIDRLYAEMRKAIADPGVREKMTGLGLTARGSTPAELGAATKDQFEMYRKLITEKNIKAD
jgi:tripartite-type tricarboxylate transporter receptor subunit TctC